MPNPSSTPSEARRPWRVGALTQLDSDAAVGLSVFGVLWPGLGAQVTVSHNRDARDVGNLVPSSHRLRMRLQLAWVHDLRQVTLDVGDRTTRLPTDRLRASFGVALGPSR